MTEALTQQRPETEAREIRTRVLVSGLPGDMATLVAQRLAQHEHFDLLPVAMTSARHRRTSQTFGGNRRVNLVDYCPFDLESGAIAVDFTTPQSAEVNAISYTRLRIPFVMGTTGGNKEEIEEMVRNSDVSAVIAPNMSMDVISRQIEIDEIASQNPGFFAGSSVYIRESHQKTKKDISGTALAFKAQFERHGADIEMIESIRDTETQLSLGIPNPDAGHGYHWVWVTNPNGEFVYSFATKINGRSSYVDGTFAAVDFLTRKMQEGSRGEIFTMRDVVENLRSAA